MRIFRSAIAAFVLFRSAAALGQPVIGSEIVSGSVPARDELVSIAAPAIAMARDTRGTAIAWTARNVMLINTVYVARIDETGRIVGDVREVPKASAAMLDATSPSMSASPTGSGFTLAWLEVSRYGSPILGSPVYCQLDSDLNPSLPQVLTAAPQDTTDSPVVARSGMSSWIAAAGKVWRVRRDGTVDVPIFSGINTSDMVAIEDSPVLVSAGRIQLNTFTCSPEPNCKAVGGPFNGFCYDRDSCRIYKYSSALRLMRLFVVSTITILPFDSFDQPAIQSNGRDILVAWLFGDEQSGGVVTATRLDVASLADFAARVARDQLFLGKFGPDAGRTRPDIATDGERYVVVWRTTTATGDHDVVGASIDRSGNVAYMSIATSPVDERDPSVLAVGNGRFLVAYEKISGGDRRLAGRFIDFEPRRRTVRN